MTGMKILGAAAILSAAIATPVFAQDLGVTGPGSRYGLEPQPGPTYDGRGYYGGPTFYSAPAFFAPYGGYGWNGYFVGRDGSRVGDVAPSLRPSGS
jgi:hypothetical protein